MTKRKVVFKVQEGGVIKQQGYDSMNVRIVNGVLWRVVVN
jgi:hypothetical protein